jgi:uncharacterized protein YndB with AHSA1/START domain
MSTDTMTTTQVNRVFIKATPEAIWNAITQPEWSDRYGYGGKVDYDLRAGGAYKAYASDAMKQAGAAGGFRCPTWWSMAGDRADLPDAAVRRSAC